MQPQDDHASALGQRPSMNCDEDSTDCDKDSLSHSNHSLHNDDANDDEDDVFDAQQSINLAAPFNSVLRKRSLIQSDDDADNIDPSEIQAMASAFTQMRQSQVIVPAHPVPLVLTRHYSASSQASNTSTRSPLQIHAPMQLQKEDTIDAMTSALSAMHDQHRQSRMMKIKKSNLSASSLPELRSYNSHGSQHSDGGLKILIDTAMPSLSLQVTAARSMRTPTLQTQETKELCDILGHINEAVNDINNFVLNVKPMRRKDKEDLTRQLQKIQDHVEDSEVFIEDRIDKQLVDLAKQQQVLATRVNDSDEVMGGLRRELQEARNTIHSLRTQTPASMISSLSHIDEDKERDLHPFPFDDERKVRESVEWQEEMLRVKQSMHEMYQRRMQEFMEKLKDANYNLPNNTMYRPPALVQLIDTEQHNLHEHNHAVKLELDGLRQDIQRHTHKISNQNSTNSRRSLLSSVYEEKINEHEEDVRSKLNELASLDMNTLQLKMDIMDILHDQQNQCYPLFFNRFILRLSRMFFESSLLLNTDDDENGFHSSLISDAMMTVLQTVPLATTIVNVSDVLNHSANAKLNIRDLKPYAQNIANFRILLSAVHDAEFDFCQRLAVAILHSRYIKPKKNTHSQEKYVGRKVKLIYDIIVSMLTRNVAQELLQRSLGGDMQKFIDLCVLVVKNPPILDQVDLTTFGKKTHKMHYKNVLANELNFSVQKEDMKKQRSTDEGRAAAHSAFHGIVHEYYNLYRSNILMQNVRRFRADMRHGARSALQEADAEMDNMSDVSSGEGSGDDDDDDSGDDDELSKSEAPLGQTPHVQGSTEKKGIFTLFNSLFLVKCVD